MKKIFFIIILMAVLNIGAFGQDEENNNEEIKKEEIKKEEIRNKERKFTIQTSPLFLVISILSGEITSTNNMDELHFIMDLEGQFRINDLFNAALTISYLIDNDGDTSLDYINLKPMFIIRPFRTGLKGFYVGFYPAVGWYFERNENEDEDNKNATIIGFGINSGYKWIFRRGFTIQAGIGFEKIWFIPETTSLSNSNNTFRRLLNYGIIDFKLGYSF